MISQWSARRKFLTSLVIFIFAIVAIGIPAYLSTHSTPTCNDRVQNGDETGVDCGGSCELLCKPSILPIVVKGDARLLKIATSTYEAVVLIENPNVNGSVVRAPYTFSIFKGTSSKPVKVITADTYVGRSSTFALFAGPFTLEDGSYRAVFAFSPDLVWTSDTKPVPSVSATDVNLVLGTSTPPLLEANLVNHDPANVIANVEVVALLSDVSGNIVAANKTFIDQVGASQEEPLSFSWPGTLPTQAVSIRILPHVLPDRSYIH